MYYRLSLGSGHRCSALALIVITTACACGSQVRTTPFEPAQPDANGSEETSTDSGSGASSSTSGQVASDGDAGSSESLSGSDGAAGPDVDNPEPSQEDASSLCAHGQVTGDEVVMLGDSYLDPAWGNIGPTLMTEANATYRHYYIGGASLAWGNPSTQLFIPYQYDPMALTDLAVAKPSDIKVVIMDGGGNDILIGNTSCETTAPPGNTSCVTTLQNAVNEVHTKMQEMAQNGVQTVVYFFYPHLNPAGGGFMQTPAPAINETLDYAYPIAEQVCCGSSFTTSLTNYSCSGQAVPGLTCVFIDTRPAFEGHIAEYIKSDNVHPTQKGANVIANLIWTQMQDHCIAQ